jgi:hypothetical protein
VRAWLVNEGRTVDSKLQHELRAFLGAWPMILLALFLLVAFTVPSVHQALGALYGEWFPSHQHAPVGCRTIMQEQRRCLLRLSLMGIFFWLEPAVRCYRRGEPGAFTLWTLALVSLLLLNVYALLPTWFI